jgi:hypothetical protein
MKRTNTTTLFTIVVAVMALSLSVGIILSPPSFARDKLKPAEPPNINPEEVTGNNQKSYVKAPSEEGAGEGSLPDNYPTRFDVVGPLSDLRTEEIVIGETLVTMSGSVSYYDTNGDAIFKNYFKPGVFVGIVLNEGGEIEQVWRLKNKTE